VTPYYFLRTIDQFLFLWNYLETTFTVLTFQFIWFYFGTLSNFTYIIYVIYLIIFNHFVSLISSLNKILFEHYLSICKNIKLLNVNLYIPKRVILNHRNILFKFYVCHLHILHFLFKVI
jgi:hypothetical protein